MIKNWRAINKESWYDSMMEGLVATVIEKINVLGLEDAEEEVNKIGAMVDDLEMFWNADQCISDICWSGVLDDEVAKQRELNK